ncbi:hypothetical protein M9Y10_017712 [Tritrichomonas musculus]|uniref:Small GTP-binding protein n=1 Tax=Tritrichomonas musculus TaxID=1915356 RepID=A0ABR2HUA9_9EUKA
MNDFHHEKAVKIVMLGNCSVGKTSLVMQFYNKLFMKKSNATICGNYISKIVQTNNGDLTLNIWDTAGEEKFRSLMPMYTRGSQAAIIVFNIQDEDSFLSVPEWIDLIQKNELYRCKIYIVANQIDLGKTPLLNKARTWAASNNYKFFVASAKYNDAVTDIFQCIAEELNGNDNYHMKTQFSILQQRKKKKCC